MSLTDGALIGPKSQVELEALCRFGDVLLYTPSGAFGELIAIKTWEDFSHCEIFVGGDDPNRRCWAARDPTRWLPRPSGGGVAYYPFRASNLAVIRRPHAALSVAEMRAFMDRAVGQQYDWWGLLRFFKIGKGKLDRMFCSEAAVRALRHGTCELFENVDADKVPPGWLDVTRDLGDVWRLKEVDDFERGNSADDAGPAGR